MLASGCCERLTWRTARLDWNATSITWVKRNADCVRIALRLRNGNVADLGATRWTADCWLRHRAADLGCAGHRAARRCWNVAGSCTTSVTAAAHLRNALVLIFTENFYCDVNRWKARRWLMKFFDVWRSLKIVGQFDSRMAYWDDIFYLIWNFDDVIFVLVDWLRARLPIVTSGFARTSVNASTRRFSLPRLWHFATWITRLGAGSRTRFNYTAGDLRWTQSDGTTTAALLWLTRHDEDFFCLIFEILFIREI